MEAQRHGETEQHTDTELEPDAMTGPAPGQWHPLDDPDLSTLDSEPLATDPQWPAMDDDTMVIDADAIDDPPPHRPRAFDAFSDDEPGGAFFASFDHGPGPVRPPIDDEVLEGEEDEEAAPVLRIGGWLHEIEIEPSPVSLADSVTTLLPLVSVRPPTDFDPEPEPAPQLNLPVPRPRAWLLPGGRNGNLTDDWEPQHKHPRTMRLRYAAATVAAVGVGAITLYTTLSGSSDPKAANSPAAPAASSATTDSAGGVLVSADNPTPSPSTGPSHTPGQTRTGGPGASPSPSTSGSTLGIGGPPPSSPPPFSFQIEAEAAELGGTGLQVAASTKASGGQVIHGLNEIQNAPQNWVRFHVTPTVAGIYHVTIWYADSNDQTVTMTVNDQAVDRLLPASGADGNVGSATIDVSLIAGDNLITWTSKYGTGPDLDKFAVAP